jgi:hypothetical protein
VVISRDQVGNRCAPLVLGQLWPVVLVEEHSRPLVQSRCLFEERGGPLVHRLATAFLLGGWHGTLPSPLL